MTDNSARRGYDPSVDESGWGSPMPAEYGSLTAFLPPLDDSSAQRDPGPRRAERRGNERRAERRPGAPKSPVTDGKEPPTNGTSTEPNETPVWAPPAVDGAGDGKDAAHTTPAPPRTAGAGRNGPEPASGAAPVTRDPLRGPAPMPGHPQRGSATTAVPAPVRPAIPSGQQQSQTTAGRSGGEQTRESPGTRRQQRRETRPQWAQSKRTIRHLNVWTVFKVSLAFYFMLLVALIVASIILWYVADAFGSIQTIEKSVKTLFDLSKFTIHPGEVAKYTAIGGAILAVCGTLANVLVAFMYNLVSDLVGGLRFDVIDEGR